MNPRRPSPAALLFAAALATSGCLRHEPGESGELRVATLAPNLTEIVFAIDGAPLLCGRTDVCDFPPEVAEVPIVGHFGAAFPEALAATRATLLLSTEYADPAMHEAVARLGIREECIPCQRLADIPPAVLRIGGLLGRTAQAEALAARLAAGIEEGHERAARIPDDQKPLVFLEMWDSPMMTPGKQSFLSEMVALAGGRNLGDELAGDGYVTLSPEWVVGRDPDVIVCLYGGDDASARERVASRVGWKDVRAVKDGRVYADFDTDAVCRPGPRVLEGARELERLLDNTRY
ncbi:MAG: ABC transporter substrate-binding protein [Kiritimatiellia bacterium]|jgi:iron complex transport system substrate-binding protein